MTDRQIEIARGPEQSAGAVAKTRDGRAMFGPHLGGRIAAAQVDRPRRSVKAIEHFQALPSQIFLAHDRAARHRRTC